MPPGLGHGIELDMDAISHYEEHVEPVNWELDSRVALVTGAAAGIGAAISEALAASGATVHGADIAWQDDSPSLAGRVELDVTDREAVRRAVDGIVAAEGRLDILVNAAGTMRAHDDLLAYDDEDWDRIVGVNGRGTFTCIQEAARVDGAGVGDRQHRVDRGPQRAHALAAVRREQGGGHQPHAVGRLGWWPRRASASTRSARD